MAPSPTGALHLGNARTFIMNWALARREGWRILLRIEDLDSPRVKQGSDREAIDLLTRLGIDWDEGPLYQSADLEPYRAAMRSLAAAGRAYACVMSRAEIEEATGSAASAPQEGSHEVAFPASLRPPDVGGGRAVASAAGTTTDSASPGVPHGAPAPDHQRLDGRTFHETDANWRLIVNDPPLEFTDAFAGPQRVDVARIVGDFVLWTKRGVPAYQLAVVVDDARQRVTHVVRGDDLLDSAARQLLVARALGLEWNPTFLHLPLVRGPDGRRLAKRHGDTRVARYLDAGVPPERIIGLLAAWSGILPRSAPHEMTSREFRDRLDLTRMPRESVVMTPEDDAWLWAGVRS